MSTKTRKLVFTALFAALTTAFTMISVPLATGYFNFGDLVIFISSVLLGPLYGAIVGAIGGALGDLILSYVAYMPFTLVIKAIEGVIVGFLYKAITKFCKDKNSGNIFEIIFTLLANLLAGSVMALGYFLAEGLILSDAHWTGGIAQLPFNFLQGVVSAVVAIILLYPCQLKKIFGRYFNKNSISREKQETHSEDDTQNTEDKQQNESDSENEE
ncbi:MAG: ECF transporter S component [Clostridiales bacterium]|nr:ECF transporter S component [Clostridiales bacterium]